MNRKRIQHLLLALAPLALCLAPGVAPVNAQGQAHPLGAQPVPGQQRGAPVGNWQGQFSNGAVMVLYLGADQSAYLQIPGMDPVSGTYTWNPTSAAGGIITLTYSRVGFTNRLYYSVSWTGEDGITLSDPYFSINMRRR